MYYILICRWYHVCLHCDEWVVPYSAAVAALSWSWCRYHAVLTCRGPYAVSQILAVYISNTCDPLKTQRQGATFEYLNDFREYEWFSSIWKILEYLNDFRIFEWIFRIWIIIEYLNDFRLFELFSSIWMIFGSLNDFRVFEWFSSIWMIF